MMEINRRKEDAGYSWIWFYYRNLQYFICLSLSIRQIVTKDCHNGVWLAYGNYYTLRFGNKMEYMEMKVWNWILLFGLLMLSSQVYWIRKNKEIRSKHFQSNFGRKYFTLKSTKSPLFKSFSFSFFFKWYSRKQLYLFLFIFFS